MGLYAETSLARSAAWSDVAPTAALKLRIGVYGPGVFGREDAPILQVPIRRKAGGVRAVSFICDDRRAHGPLNDMAVMGSDDLDDDGGC